MKPRHVHDKSGVICNHVQKGKRPLRIVAQDRDGVWQFMCGMDDHASPKQAKTVCVDCALDKHAGALTREEVARGHIATRGNSKAPWAVREMSAEETGQIEETTEDGPAGASPLINRRGS